MSTIAKGRHDHSLHGLIKISTIVHNNGIFTPHLGNHPFQVFLSRLQDGSFRINATAHRLGTRKGDEMSVFMFHQVCPHIGSNTGNVLEYSLRNPRFHQNFCEFGSNYRRSFRWFEEGTIPGDQGRNGHARGDR